VHAFGGDIEVTPGGLRAVIERVARPPADVFQRNERDVPVLERGCEDDCPIFAHVEGAEEALWLHHEHSSQNLIEWCLRR
jgi:hypothetical protein